MKKLIYFILLFGLVLSFLAPSIVIASDGPWTGYLEIWVDDTATVNVTLTTQADLEIYWDEDEGAWGDDYIKIFVNSIAITDSYNYSYTKTVSLPSGNYSIGFKCTSSGAGDYAPIDYIITAKAFTGTYYIPELDTIPPVINVSVNPNILFPADRKMVDIVSTLNVSDVWDPNPQVVLLSITSNQPDDGLGDGNTSNDIVITGNEFKLRAEFSGKAGDRIYTITYQATDWNGNTSIKSTTVTVPRKPIK